jgi:hypothetical protein
MRIGAARPPAAAMASSSAVKSIEDQIKNRALDVNPMVDSKSKIFLVASDPRNEF